MCVLPLRSGLSRRVHGRAAGAVGQGNPPADGGHEEPSPACRLRVRTGRHGEQLSGAIELEVLGGTPHASALRIHRCSFDPVACFPAMTGVRMAITSARRIWSRRRVKMEPQYLTRAPRQFPGPWPFRVAATSTRSHAMRNVGTLDNRRAAVESPAAARQTDGWRRLGEPDVRTPAEIEVAALAVDGQSLHPAAAPAAGLDDRGRAFRHRRGVPAARPGSACHPIPAARRRPGAGRRRRSARCTGGRRADRSSACRWRRSAGRPRPAPSRPSCRRRPAAGRCSCLRR